MSGILQVLIQKWMHLQELWTFIGPLLYQGQLPGYEPQLKTVHNFWNSLTHLVHDKGRCAHD